MPEATVQIPCEGNVIEACLGLPDHPAGLIIFAHGKGGLRGQGRSGLFARDLQKAGLATLDFDLLTRTELALPDYKFDVDAAANRLDAIVLWATANKDTRDLPISLLGFGTGTSAALVVAAQPGNPVRALVSCGGRPEFAAEAVLEVMAPSLFIVGGFDWAIIDLNEAAVSRMRSIASMEVVERATNSFEEDGAVEAAARLARAWFIKWIHQSSSREESSAARA